MGNLNSSIVAVDNNKDPNQAQAYTKRELQVLAKYLKDFPHTFHATKAEQKLIVAHWDSLFNQSKSTDATQASTIVQLFDNFYRFLFEAAPEVKPLFRSSMQVQGKALVNIVGAIRNMLVMPDITQRASALAERHVKYGIKPEHFNALGVALMKTLECCSGDLWTNDIHNAWKSVYTDVAILVIIRLEKHLKKTKGITHFSVSFYSGLSSKGNDGSDRSTDNSSSSAPISKDATCPVTGTKLSDMPPQIIEEVTGTSKCPYHRFWNWRAFFFGGSGASASSKYAK